MPLDSDALRAILDFLAKAVAAGCGAWAAFRLQESREVRKQRQEYLYALREALFALSAQRSYLLNLEQQHLEPLRGDAERHLLMKPLFGAGPLQSLDFKKLVFLLKFKETGSLISELHLAEARCQTAVELVQERNGVHSRFQARLEVAPEGSGEINSDSISLLVGRSTVQQLRALTDGLYLAVADGISTNRTAASGIQEFMKTAFPNERVPRLIEGPGEP